MHDRGTSSAVTCLLIMQSMQNDTFISNENNPTIIHLIFMLLFVHVS